MNFSRNAAERREKKLNGIAAKIFHKFTVMISLAVLIFIGFIGVTGISAGLGVWKGIIDTAPEISVTDVIPTGYYTTVFADDGTTELATLVASGSNRKYVTIQDVPLHLQHAFVAIEDSRFYEHNGIDLYGIGRAFVSGVSKGFHFNEGASTITQQLIKNNVLTSWTTETSMIEKLQRKVQEQFLAVELEQQVSKEWILENYMNSINLGSNTLGVQAACQKYFGKDVSEITVSEAAVIASITQNPSKYNPITHPDYNYDRRAKVLENMKNQGYITDAEEKEALEDDVYSRIASHYTAITQEKNYNTYYVDALIDDVYDDLLAIGYSSSDAYKLLYNGGLSIVSNQNLYIQSIVDSEVEDPDNYDLNTTYSFILAFQVKKADGTYKNYTNNTMLSYYKNKYDNNEFGINYSSPDACYEAIAEYENEMLEEGDELVEGSESVYITPQPEVAMTVIDQYTGKVMAISGGRGEKVGNRTWNRATDTTRQPGSTFKIISCYAPAIETGDKTLASTQLDENYTVGNKTYRGSRGWCTVRYGIQQSINVVAVKNLQDIGVDTGFAFAEKFGITTLTEEDRSLSLCLGGLTKGVTNLELTGAYAAIANQGTYMEPKFYSIVYDHDGNVLLDMTQQQEVHEVLSPQSAWLVTNAMEDVLTKGTGGKAYFGDYMAQAGKTGTTTSNRDLLFAGFTPYYTCVVWGGYDDNSIQDSGYVYPKRLWKSVMGRLHEELPYKDFDCPDGIRSAVVCADSGGLPNDYCPTRREFFKDGTGPGAACTLHVRVEICKETGQLAGEYCEETELKVFTRDQKPSKECEKHTEEWFKEEERKKQEEEEKKKQEEEEKKKQEEEKKKQEEEKQQGAAAGDNNG